MGCAAQHMHNIAAKTCLFLSRRAPSEERNCLLSHLVKARLTRTHPVTLQGLRVIFDPSYAHPLKSRGMCLSVSRQGLGPGELSR